MTKKELQKKLKIAQQEVDVLTREMSQTPGGVWLLKAENACRYGRAMGIRDTLREVLEKIPKRKPVKYRDPRLKDHFV